MDTLFIPASLVAGGLLAVQAGANAQLSKATGSPFTATTLQLSVDTLALLAVALAIGAAAAVGLTVAGQQVASVFVDRYGWFRLPQRPVSGLRMAGVAVLLLGVATIKML